MEPFIISQLDDRSKLEKWTFHRFNYNDDYDVQSSSFKQEMVTKKADTSLNMSIT
jgi:hypothetical protein